MKRALPFLVMLGALAVGLAWYMFWWGPSGDEVSKDKAATAVAANQTKQLEAQLTRLKKWEGRTKELEAKAQDLGARIPSDASLDTFIQEANVIATRNGIAWVSIAPTRPAANGPAGLGTIGFTMELEGTYPELRDYLEQIMEGDRLVVLDSVSLQASAAGTEAQTLRASVNGRMFTTAAVGGSSTNGASGASTAGSSASASPAGETGVTNN